MTKADLIERAEAAYYAADYEDEDVLADCLQCGGRVWLTPLGDYCRDCDAEQ